MARLARAAAALCHVNFSEVSDCSGFTLGVHQLRRVTSENLEKGQQRGFFMPNQSQSLMYLIYDNGNHV